MAIPSNEALAALAADMRDELARLNRLTTEIKHALRRIHEDPADAALFFDSLSLKLQNFYTGCERIFQLVANELNGGLPSGGDWHRRLLSRARLRYRDRPAVISEGTAAALEPYLGFRHVARNAYGFELDHKRVDELAREQARVHAAFATDVEGFLKWLDELSLRAEQP